MENSCRVCLLSDITTMYNLTDFRNDDTIRDIMSYVSGIEVIKDLLLLNFRSLKPINLHSRLN